MAGTAEPTVGRPRSLTLSALVTYGTSVAGAALAFLNVLLVARALGPTGRGDVALFTVIVTITSTLGLGGVEDANVVFAGRNPSQRRSLAANSLVLGGLFGALSAGALLLLLDLVPGIGGDLSPVLRGMAVITVPFIILRLYFEFLVQADYRFRLTNSIELGVPLGILVLNGGFAVAGHLTSTIACGAWAAGQALAVVTYMWYVPRRWVGFGRFRPALARQTLGFGIKVYPNRVMNLANYRLDQWLLGTIAGSRELGLYSVAIAWAEVLWFLPNAIALVQRPDLVRLPLEKAGERAATALRVTLIVTIPIVAFMVFAAPILLVVFFGDAFEEATGQLRLVALGAIGILLLKMCGNALVAQMKPRRSQIAIAASFLLTIALDIVLIPPFGGVGAAIASLVAYSAAGIVIVLIFTRTMHVSLSACVPRWRDVQLLRERVVGAARPRKESLTPEP